MTGSILSFSLAVAALTGSGEGTGGGVLQPDLDGPPHAKPRLVCETIAAAPGATAWLGISFDIDAKWHIYWDGDGDTGQPVVAEFTLPPGYKVGEIVWPTPKRYILAETILDYTYESKVTLLVPLEVPATAKPGDTAKISAALKWMECSEECLPRKAKVVLDLPIASAERVTKSSDAAKFEDTRKRVPKPLSETEKSVKTRWKGDTLSLHVPGATRLTFFPHRTTARLKDALNQGDARKDELLIDVDLEKSRKVIGILEVVRGSHDAKPHSEFYWIESTADAPESGSRAK